MPTDKNRDSDKTNDVARKKPRSRRLSKVTCGLLATTALAGGGLVTAEIHYSYVQSRVFNSIAAGRIGAAEHRSDSNTAAPAKGPYDQRLGYTETLRLRQTLESKGYKIDHETSWLERKIAGISINPLYPRKTQAGLRIVDDNEQDMYTAQFPRQAYQRFDDIPPLVRDSLLYVENRSLLREQPENWNHAIEWPRFVRAIIGQVQKKVGMGGDQAGGSTLATQIEKFQHSEGGQTSSGVDKLSQMISASARAYMGGLSTAESQQETIREYFNSMPLSSYPRHGEVIGFAEGLKMWFGTDFNDLNRALSKPESEMSDTELAEAARYYRQSLSLIMAVKKPSAYLLRERAELEKRIDDYLKLMVDDNIISERMKNAVLAQRVEYTNPATVERPVENRQKAAEALQIDLLKTLGMPGLYELRRLDMTATTTVDAHASAAATRILQDLTNPDIARENGLTGYRLLSPEAADKVVYAFTLYERLPDGTNVLRVQTDNYHGQLNLNEDTKLELGSTAKLRTLVSYLEAFADLHAKYAGTPAEELRAISVQHSDNITRWALDYLASPDTDKSLEAMLEGALERRYSANPHERFFTGGGVHTFSNFERKENGGVYSVRQALYNSTNLVFVRMMRDIVNYTETNKMGIAPDILENPDSPQRRAYLERFVHAEGTTFLWRAFTEQRDKSAEDVAALLAGKTRRTPVQLAVLHRSMFPDAPVAEMEKFIRAECTGCTDRTDYQKLYDTYAKDKFNLNDRAYLTRIHPLALWLASYRQEKPDSTWAETVEAAADTRIESYKWLLDSKKIAAQNTRILIMLEQEAFTHIHKTWKNLGYGFDRMVPSYASALGSSGDTPAGLAELAGIIQNDGLRRQPIKFQRIVFGENTPYELDMRMQQPAAARVLPEEVARIARREMQGVVEQGTGRRIRGAVRLSDGTVLPVGGKTGTGDNRIHTFARGGAITSSSATSRTGTFVYIIDDRFFGCITAYVDGPEADKYTFTSGLATQVLKVLQPAIQQTLDRAYGVTPQPANDAAAPAGDAAPVSAPPAPVPVAAPLPALTVSFGAGYPLPASLDKNFRAVAQPPLKITAEIPPQAPVRPPRLPGV